VQLDIGQATEPDRHLVPLAGLAQQARNGVATQRGLEGEVGAIGHGLAQAAGAFLPGLGVGLRQRPAGVDQAAGESGLNQLSPSASSQVPSSELLPAPLTPASARMRPIDQSGRPRVTLRPRRIGWPSTLPSPPALQAGQGLVELAAQAQQFLAALTGITAGGLGQQFLVGADVHDHRFRVVVVGDDQRLLLAHGAHQARPAPGLHRRGRGLFEARQIQRQGHGTAPGRVDEATIPNLAQLGINPFYRAAGPRRIGLQQAVALAQREADPGIQPLRAKRSSPLPASS
jgi:hypothetical protein